MAASNPVSWTAAQGFTAVKTRYFARVAGTGAGTITYALRKGTTTLLSITVNVTDTSASSTPSVAIADGDNLNVEVTFAGEFTVSPTDITWTIGVTA